MWGQIGRALWRRRHRRRTPAQYGIGGLIARRRRHLLRLYRLRSGLDRRRGIEEPGARHADRHPRLADHLHDPLHPHLRGAGRHRALHRTQRSRRRSPRRSNAIGLPWFAFLVKLGAFAGLSSVMLVLLYGQTRIFYTMARDGLLPSVFANVNTKTKTPVVNTLLVGVVAAGFAGFKGLDFLGDITNVGTLVAFGLICITVIYLRFARPEPEPSVQDADWLVDPHRGARRGHVLRPVHVADGERADAQLLPVYLAGGFVIYFVYGMWNSKLGRGIVVTGHEPQPDLGATGVQRDDTEPLSSTHCTTSTPPSKDAGGFVLRRMRDRVPVERCPKRETGRAVCAVQ